MKHIFFIDPLEKLNTKKDSSLLMATALKEQGKDVVILFEQDFFIENKTLPTFVTYQFESELKENDYYLKSFKITQKRLTQIDKHCLIHFRLDPPFDTRYLRILWMLSSLEDRGVKVCNSPKGVIQYNEKLNAYAHDSSLPSYVGSSLEGFLKFASSLQEDEIILKPLDLYQGMGVIKVKKDAPDLGLIFQNKVKEHEGALVAQPFYAKVKEGEIRSLYFDGEELGSILKVPKEGEFLANIAQGASFKAIDLSDSLKNACNEITQELLRFGVRFVAFDILGDCISEVNITCPGLLVEVSHAHKRNLASTMAESMEQSYLSNW
jgi:glutathione synthase